jgi:hypothetical protein
LGDDKAFKRAVLGGHSDGTDWWPS